MAIDIVACAAVVAASSDTAIGERVVVRIVHSVDGGWGIGGHAFTNDEIDEGPDGSGTAAGGIATRPSIA